MDNAKDVFSGTDGPVISAAFAIFAKLYTALVEPFANAADGIMSEMISLTHSWVAAGVVAMIIVFMAAYILRHEDVDPISKLLTDLLIPVAIVLMLLQSASNYHQFVVDWLRAMPDTIGGVANGVVGGTPVTNGSLFDLLFSHCFKLGVKVWKAVPTGWSNLGTAFMMAVIIGLYWISSGLAILVMFGAFAISKITLALFLAISPLFVGAAAYRPSRFAAKGFLSAVLSILVAQVLVVVLLAITMKVLDEQLPIVMSAPDNSDIFSFAYVLIIIGCTMGIGAILTMKIPSFAVGIAGGVFDGLAPWISAGKSAGAAAGRVVGLGGGGGGGGGSGRPGATPAGRNMSRA